MHFVFKLNPFGFQPAPLLPRTIEGKIGRQPTLAVNHPVTGPGPVSVSMEGPAHRPGGPRLSKNLGNLTIAGYFSRRNLFDNSINFGKKATFCHLICKDLNEHDAIDSSIKGAYTHPTKPRLQDVGLMPWALP